MKKSKEKPEETEPKLVPSSAFMTVLNGHANGEACQELTEGMRECVEAVQLTGKPAVMALKVKFLPAGRGGAFIIAPEVSIKLPALQKATSIWFADHDFVLHRDNPDQKQMELKAVPVVQERPATVERVG